MYSKNSVVFATNDLVLQEETKNILQYLNNQLLQLNFIVKELHKFEDNNREILTTTIEKYLQNCTIFLISDQSEIIFEVLSNIFNEKLTVSKHLASIYKLSIDSENACKFTIPNSSNIFQIQNYINGINPICIKLRNVFVLPNNLNSIKVIFQNIIIPLLTIESNYETFGKRFVLRCNQNGFGNILNETVSKVNDSVKIIKYCTVNKDSCDLNVTLTCSKFDKLVLCLSAFKSIVSKSLIMEEIIDEKFWGRLEALQNDVFVQQTLQIITDCYSRYQPQDVFLSFNGGKDCTVLLYLTLFVLRTVHPDYKEPLLCLYIRSKDPFDEVETFIDQCKLFFNLDVVAINNSVKEGLEEILKQRPNLAACFMGTRRTDPFAANLHHFEMTDQDWPQIMRVNPVLDWKYCEIWNFLLTCKIPYCKLYDLGYTSLGSKTNTGPNPDLKFNETESEHEFHYPAYKLIDETKERSGRFK